MSAESLIKHSQYRGLVLQVAVPSPLYRSFDYLPVDSVSTETSSRNTVPADTEISPSRDSQPGTRVLVPFGNRKVVGIVTGVSSQSALSEDRLKSVLAVLDSEPVFTASLFKVLLWAASYYQHPIGEVMATALPARLRSVSDWRPQATFWKVAEGISVSELGSLKRAARQKALLEFIDKKGKVSRDQWLAAGFNRPLVSQLQKKNLITKFSSVVVGKSTTTGFDPISRDNKISIHLNAEQRHAVEKITAGLNKFSCYLLDGVTGSGKTEVYMRTMQEQLAAGKQCLVLVPEIGLTPQSVSRFQQRFSCPIVALHSGLTDRERASAWDQARQGDAGIIIGTRSAVFTPMRKPGLIIVDEEHDPSFKQQDGFRYSARDLAVVRAREEKVCIILGSATPSLESFQNARSNKFIHLRLTERAGEALPLAMELIDIASAPLDNGFSEQLLYKIQKHIDAMNQVLVFINRRGFAPVLNCQNCGWVAECENCVAQYTVHAKPPSIRCHHCGSSRQLPRYCPSCKSRSLATFGIGTQKIEAFLIKKFPGIPVLRIDRDSTRGRNSLANLLERIEKGDPCILLGTQMLAKGHHFPNITLVAILDADTGLFSADFRGQEHMAQTITQVAGRAGRAERAGEVIIQSRHSSHITLQTLVRASYAELAELLFAEREASGMPPFSHLCLIRAEAIEVNDPISYLKQVAVIAKRLCAEHALAVTCLGPLPAPMEKRAGRYRIQLLLNSKNRGAIQNLLEQLTPAISALKHSRKLRWSIDVDPQDLI